MPGTHSKKIFVASVFGSILLLALCLFMREDIAPGKSTLLRCAALSICGVRPGMTRDEIERKFGPPSHPEMEYHKKYLLGNDALEVYYVNTIALKVWGSILENHGRPICESDIVGIGMVRLSSFQLMSSDGRSGHAYGPQTIRYVDQDREDELYVTVYKDPPIYNLMLVVRGGNVPVP